MTNSTYRFLQAVLSRMNGRCWTIARRLVVSCLAVYWLALFVGTHLPLSQQGGPKVNDKLLHLTAYTGLGFLLAWACLRLNPSRFRVFVTLATVAVYGTIDELSQMLVPDRTADIFDWLMDFSGGLIGLLLYFASWWVVTNWLGTRNRLPAVAPPQPAP